MTVAGPRRSAASPWPRRVELILLLAILAVAAGFRLYKIGQVPPGPHYDEAANALDTLDTLDGYPMLFSPRSYGREQLFVWVAAPFVALLGPTLVAIRLPIALVGVLTVLTTYLLARELLHDKGERRAQQTALLAAAFLALSFWHLALNHLGFRANYLPLLETLSFLFLWRAVRTNRLAAYAIGGFFLGLSLYTYTSSRFVPIVLVVFFSLILAGRQGRRWVRPRLPGWVLLAVVALLVVVPLLVYFLLHPEQFLLRARGVSILSPALHGGAPWGLVVRSVLGNFGLFGIKGDPNWVYNLPGRPGLDPVQAALFWLGILLCLLRWQKPQRLFLAVWWLVMLLPSILAPDPIPHSLRAIGTLPAAIILAALALTGLIEAFSRLPPRLRGALQTLALLALPLYMGWLAYDTWHSYFDLWAPREEVYYAYYGYYADLADQVNRDTDPSAILIFPVNYDRRGDDYTAYPLDLLAGRRDPDRDRDTGTGVPYRYVVVDESTAAADLTEISAGKSRVRLVVWTHGEHIDADPRQVLPFHLERFGRQVEEQAFRGYRIVTYDLTSAQVDFRQPLAFSTLAATFDSVLALQAVAHEPRSPSGEAAWVALRWAALQPPGADLKVSLRVRDDQGRLAGQSDLWLMSNEHLLASRWLATAEVTTYHLIPMQPDTPPGDYHLGLVVYEPESLVPLPRVDEAGNLLWDELPLGTVQVGRPGASNSGGGTTALLARTTGR